MELKEYGEQVYPAPENVNDVHYDYDVHYDDNDCEEGLLGKGVINPRIGFMRKVYGIISC